MDAFTDAEKKQEATMHNFAQRVQATEKMDCKAARDAARDHDWDREAAVHIVKVNTSVQIDRVSLLARLTTFFAEVDVRPEMFELLGPAIGTRWTINLCKVGTFEHGRLRGEKILANLRVGDQWRDISITQGSLTATIYFERDKAPPQERLELLTRKIGKLVKGALAGREKEVFIQKKEGILFVGWQPVVRVKVVSRTSAHLEWKKEAAAAQGIDFVALDDAWKKAGRVADDVGWDCL